MDHPRPAFLVGRGSVDRVAHASRALDAEAVVIDEPISPRQQRNWEKYTELGVMDRQAVILEIFRRRATTREAQLQVRLAQAEYNLPRLKNAWNHFSRQAGAGQILRGEGEKQLEIDRRLVQKRIQTTKRDLDRVSKQRSLRRKNRTRLFQAAFVGYTNAGKSTLLNRLTNSDVLVQNKLFATLDPTTRRLRSQNGETLLLTDTVGFVRKLPHSLVEAFHSTLEEALTAGLLLIVLDISDPEYRYHLETTVQVLTQLEAISRPIAVVLNKMDRVFEKEKEIHLAESAARRTLPEFCGVFPVSAKSGDGISDLRNFLFQRADQDRNGRHVAAGTAS
jgi:GTP-binding protein HflX